MKQWTVSTQDGNTVLSLTGRLDAKSASLLLPEGLRIIAETRTPNLILDLETVDYIDTAGAAFLCLLENEAGKKGIQNFSMVRLKPGFSTLVDMAKEVRQGNFSAQKPEALSFV